MTLLSALPGEISAYGYPALLAVCIAEGPVGTIIGGLLASLGLLNVGAVLGISLLGDAIGDLLYYWAGRRAVSWPWLQRRIHKHQDMVDVLRTRFQQAPVKALSLGKWLHAAGFAVLLAAGAFRMPIARFLGYNVLATLPKSALLVLVGYAFGAAYERIDRMLAIASVGILAVLLMAAIWYVRRATATQNADRDLHR